MHQSRYPSSYRSASPRVPTWESLYWAPYPGSRVVAAHGNYLLFLALEMDGYCTYMYTAREVIQCYTMHEGAVFILCNPTADSKARGVALRSHAHKIV